MFVKIYHGTNEGDFWGPQKRNCWCSSGWKTTYKTTSEDFGLHIHSQTDCVQMEEIQDHCYPPPEVVGQQRSLQDQYVFHQWGHKGPQGNLIFMSPLLGEQWTKMVCVSGLQEEINKQINKCIYVCIDVVMFKDFSKWIQQVNACFTCVSQTDAYAHQHTCSTVWFWFSLWQHH